MARACFSGCAAQYKGLAKASKGCLMVLKPLTHGFDAYQADPPQEQRSSAACANEDVPLPVLLAAQSPREVRVPSCAEPAPTTECFAPGELSALTTATASAASPAGASTPANLAGHGLPGCCTGGRPRHNEVCVADMSAQLGEAAEAVWLSAGHFTSFVGRQLLHAADVAKPHVVSLANSAVETLKSSMKAQAAPAALPKPTGSTWEANSRAALMARGTVTPLDLSDYDVCSDAGFTSCRTTCPPSRPMDRPMVPSGPMGYDVMRDAQLRYALERDEATTIEPQALFQTQAAQSPYFSHAPRSFPSVPRAAASFSAQSLPGSQSFHTVFPQAQSFPVQLQSFDLAQGSVEMHQTLPQAKVLRTTMGERRPFSGQRGPLVSRSET